MMCFVLEKAEYFVERGKTTERRMGMVLGFKGRLCVQRLVLVLNWNQAKGRMGEFAYALQEALWLEEGLAALEQLLVCDVLYLMYVNTNCLVYEGWRVEVEKGGNLGLLLGKQRNEGVQLNATRIMNPSLDRVKAVEISFDFLINQEEELVWWMRCCLGMGKCGYGVSLGFAQKGIWIQKRMPRLHLCWEDRLRHLMDKVCLAYSLLVGGEYERNRVNWKGVVRGALIWEDKELKVGFRKGRERGQRKVMLRQWKRKRS